MPVEPPVPVEAEVMHRPMTSGRNKAVLLGCRTTSGALFDCVVKFAACLGSFAPVPYLAEWCATALGRLLGIAVPEPFDVAVTEPFARSLDQPWRDIALRSMGQAFGAKLYAGGFSPWPARTLIPLDLRDAAADLVAFDVFIHNPDRRVDNPNSLVSRDTILAIDHDMAFMFLLPLLGDTSDPVETSLLDVVDRHVFAQALGRKIPSLDRFRAAVAAISDQDLEAIERATPAAWQAGAASGMLAKIVDVMRRRRDALERWLPEVEARIQS